MKIHNSPGAYGLLAGLLVLLLGLVANASCMPPSASAQRDPATALEQAVRIEATCFDKNGALAAFMGSGVIIDKHTIITAAHVATDPEGFVCARTATMVNDHVYEVHLGTALVNRDLGTLVSDTDFDPTYPVVFGPAPEFGERVCAMTAYPMWLWRCGDAQLPTDPPGDRMHNIIVEPGNSGSGVYDGYGRLIGIITHRWSCSNGQMCGGKFSTLEGFTSALLRSKRDDAR